MYNYSFISLTALTCYLVLFVPFLAARKDKNINSFLPVLLGSVFWTGGSFAMRVELWPGPGFWFHFSLFGLFFIPYYFYCFICSILECEERDKGRVFFWMIMINFMINLCTGFYIKAPEAVRLANGSACFVYHMGWSCFLLLAFMGVPVIRMAYLVIIHSREENSKQKQLRPVLISFAVFVLGHVCMMFFGSGIPIDMISGIISAGFLFYALYQKRLFYLDFFVSRGVVYAVTMLLVAALSSNYVNPAMNAIRHYIPELESSSVLIVAICFALITFLMAAAVKAFIDRTFVRGEFIRSENLKNFSKNVSKSLKVEDIVKEINTVIGETLGVSGIYVCVENEDGTRYHFISADSEPRPCEPDSDDCGEGQIPCLRRLKFDAPLLASECLSSRTRQETDRDFTLSHDDPAVVWLEKSRCCFTKEENREGFPVMDRFDARCMIPMVEDKVLVGIIFLGRRKKDRRYGRNEINFLESIGSIASIAVRNSRLYEQAYKEARQDDLTGLLNRKYFYKVLNEIYDQNPGRQLAIIILNIDDFKLFNQLYGIREGDAALQKMAHIISSNVGKKGYVSRYSGKEFAAALPDLGIKGAKEIAETIRNEILEMNSKGADSLMKSLTVSCGICAIPDSANNVKQLMENADMAVFSVKQKGKNGVMVYDFNAHAAIGASLEAKTNRQAYSTYRSTIYALTAAIDTKDHYTFSHSNHVAEYAGALAREYGMSEDFVELVKEAGLLHDIGKIGIPEQILNKTDRLEPDEYEIMKGHVEASIRIIRNLPSLDYVIPAVIGHHERYDGKGYPRGIAGEDIPLSARILCIVDSFDAMISKRSYKDERSVEYALDEILRNAGKQFDPQLAPLFVKAMKEGGIRPAESVKS